MMHEEREVLRKQIENLKTKCEEEIAERNASEIKANQKTENLNKMTK